MSKKNQKLKENSLGLSESVIMGVAGTAPAFSITATTSVLFAAVGLMSMASLLYCGLIMFGVSLAFLHLNRIKTNAGASYTWVSEVFHPVLGFFAGWSLLTASAVFMVSGTIPAAIATLNLISPEHIDNPDVVSIVAAGWLLFVSAIVIKGIKLSSYFQVVLTVIEVSILFFIILYALWTFYSNPVESFSWSQLSLSGFSFETFSKGALTALFFYWGWDVTVNLSEETKDGHLNSGKGAIIAMLIVLFLFLSFALAIQWGFTASEIHDSGTNLVFALAEKLFPAPWSYMAIIAVMLSTIGTLETTILQFTRTMYAKGRDKILNPRYSDLHKNWQTPWKATGLIALIGLVLLFFSAFFPTVDQLMTLSVKAIGYQVAFYYGLTSFACAFHFRRQALKSVREFILLFCWPILSGLFMAFIFLTCALTLDLTTTLFGLGCIAIGFVPLLLNKKNSIHFGGK